MNDKIHGLVKTINNSINKNEKLFITRFKKDKNKQMFLRDIILYSSKLIHTFSYQNVTTDFKSDKIKNFSSQAYNKRRSTFDLNIMDNINKDLLEYDQDNISQKNQTNLIYMAQIVVNLMFIQV